jgi:uncharacterized small protein (DUF1192 family)
MSKEEVKKNQLSPVGYIKLDDIDRTEEQFQTRHINTLLSAPQHAAKQDTIKEIKELKQELEMLKEMHPQDRRQQHLEPIVIWREPGASTGQYIIVSGFHRFDAYRLFNKDRPEKERKKKIASRVFLGSAAEAMLYSAGQDIRPILPKTQDQKKNAAWEMISKHNPAAEALSVRELASRCGLSKSTIERMRKTIATLERTDKPIYPNWKVQMVAMRSNTRPEEDTLKERKIHSMAMQLHSKFFLDGCKADTELAFSVISRFCEIVKTPEMTIEKLVGEELSGDF